MDPSGNGGGGLTPSRLFCGSCGAQSGATAKFCSECGTPLAPATRSAEYKQVTVLFADVVHSMDIAAAVGPERLREIMADLVERSAAVVKRYGGTVDKFTGDGLMVVFGAPVALEDHAFRACLAALAIQETVKELATEVQRRDHIDLTVRVGLNSGQVIAGEIGSGSLGYTAIGEHVGMAQRMESAGPAGGVMLSSSTARLVEDLAVLSGAEMVDIKGATDPVPAHRLIGAVAHGERMGRPVSTLVGREWQLGALAGMLDQAIKGHGAMKFFRATIAAALGLAVAMGCSSGEPSKESGSTAAHNGPVLDGTYRVDLDGKQRLGNGTPMPIAPISNPYAFRSACSPTGCVATGTLLQGDDIKRAADFAVTLDYVDGGWQMVAADTFTCGDGSTTPGISAWFLKPGPNGSFAGTFYAAQATGIDCVAASQAPLSLTRVGDVDPGVAIADPGAVAALSPSAPEALRGKYNQTNTYRGEGTPPSTDAVEMKTMCVRNTDQCWTLATATRGSATVEWPLLFADGKWSVTGRASRDQRCTNGSSAKTVIHTEYTMPQPVPNPIPRLTGTRTLDFSGQCTGSYAYDLVLERTGD